MNIDAIRAVLKEMREAAEDAELWHGMTYAVNADAVDEWADRIEAALTGADLRCSICRNAMYPADAICRFCVREGKAGADGAIEQAFKEGWRVGHYDGGEHDCRMFPPTAQRAWEDYQFAGPPRPREGAAYCGNRAVIRASRGFHN